MPLKPRAGNIFYKGVEIPATAKIEIVNEKECYLSSITQENDCYKYHYKVIIDGSFIVKREDKPQWNRY